MQVLSTITTGQKIKVSLVSIIRPNLLLLFRKKINATLELVDKTFFLSSQPLRIVAHGQTIQEAYQVFENWVIEYLEMFLNPQAKLSEKALKIKAYLIKNINTVFIPED
jgi:hypothetical protein